MTWNNHELNNLIAAISDVPKRQARHAQEIIEESAEYGAEEMRKMIETRGTGYKGHTGRIDEGYMLGDVAVGAVHKIGNAYIGSYGWGVTGGPVPDYYLYQENGTNRIPPMHALLDSFIKAREHMHARLRDIT